MDDGALSGGIGSQKTVWKWRKEIGNVFFVTCGLRNVSYSRY